MCSRIIFRHRSTRDLWEMDILPVSVVTPSPSSSNFVRRFSRFLTNCEKTTILTFLSLSSFRMCQIYSINLFILELFIVTSPHTGTSFLCSSCCWETWVGTGLRLKKNKKKKKQTNYKYRQKKKKIIYTKFWGLKQSGLFDIVGSCGFALGFVRCRFCRICVRTWSA